MKLVTNGNGRRARVQNIVNSIVAEIQPKKPYYRLLAYDQAKALVKPDFQRDLNEKRAKSTSQFVLKMWDIYWNWNPCITLLYDKGTKTLAFVDGQHRLWGYFMACDQDPRFREVAHIAVEIKALTLEEGLVFFANANLNSVRINYDFIIATIASIAPSRSPFCNTLSKMATEYSCKIMQVRNFLHGYAPSQIKDIKPMIMSGELHPLTVAETKTFLDLWSADPQWKLPVDRTFYHRNETLYAIGRLARETVSEPELRCLIESIKRKINFKIDGPIKAIFSTDLNGASRVYSHIKKQLGV